jgi:hypothetical protein
MVIYGIIAQTSKQLFTKQQTENDVIYVLVLKIYSRLLFQDFNPNQDHLKTRHLDD